MPHNLKLVLKGMYCQIEKDGDVLFDNAIDRNDTCLFDNSVNEVSSNAVNVHKKMASLKTGNLSSSFHHLCIC